MSPGAYFSSWRTAKVVLLFSQAYLFSIEFPGQISVHLRWTAIPAPKHCSARESPGRCHQLCECSTSCLWQSDGTAREGPSAPSVGWAQHSLQNSQSPQSHSEHKQISLSALLTPATGASPSGMLFFPASWHSLPSFVATRGHNAVTLAMPPRWGVRPPHPVGQAVLG